MLMRSLCALLLLGLFVAHPAVHADLRVNQRRDKVELNDGKIIECVLVMETEKGALIILPESEGHPPQQIFIPKDNYVKITRGVDEGRINGYQTEEKQAQKVVQGTGFRETKASKTGPIDPTGPIGPISQIAPLAGAPVPGPGGLGKPLKINSMDLIKEYYARNPGLSNTAKFIFGNPNQAAGWLDKALTAGPEVRARLEEALNRLNQEPTEAVKPPSVPKAPGSAREPKKGGGKENIKPGK